MIIRRAKQEDIEQILRLEKQNFPDYPLPEPTLKSIMSEFPDGALVAEIESVPSLELNEKVVGHINFELHEKQIIPPIPFLHQYKLCEKPRLIYLNAWCVDKKYQGKGIGSLLFDKLKIFGKENSCDGIYLALKVDHPDPKAYDRWKRWGYTDRGTYKWEEKPGSIVDVKILEKKF